MIDSQTGNADFMFLVIGYIQIPIMIHISVFMCRISSKMNINYFSEWLQYSKPITLSIHMKKYEIFYICIQIEYLDSFHECLHACIWMKLCCLTNLYSHHCILPLFTTLTSVFLELGTRRLIVKLHIMLIQCLYGKFGRQIIL